MANDPRRAKSDPRSANGHRRRRVRARVLREEDTCWLCGQPVDKSLKTPHPGSPEVDEIVPVSLGGDPFTRAGCHLAHRLCNVRRGNKSREWFLAKYGNRKPVVKPILTERAW